jgi:hypothetical protein
MDISFGGCVASWLPPLTGSGILNSVMKAGA